MTETTKRDEREAFKWPPLPGFPSAMWTCNGVGLFTEHQMQGYANAYGEAIRAALATAPEQAGEHVAWAVVNANGYAKYVTNDAEEAARWRETYQDVRPLAYAAPPAASTNRLTVTPAMVKASMPWLANLHHMRKTDKESNVEEALRAAFAIIAATEGK